MIPDIKQEILLVTEEGREEEAVVRLARVGYDFTIGYLKGGFGAWKNAEKEVDHIEQVTADELASIIETDPHAHILDVRKHSEYSSEHLLDVKNTPLDFINESMAQIDKSRKHYVHCAGGYRSMIFISILKARGFDKPGGYQGRIHMPSRKAENSPCQIMCLRPQCCNLCKRQHEKRNSGIAFEHDSIGRICTGKKVECGLGSFQCRYNCAGGSISPSQ